MYAVEETSLGGLAREIAAANGFADRIEVVRGLSTWVTLPEKADVVVTDQIGHFGIEAGIFEYIPDARRRLLEARRADRAGADDVAMCADRKREDPRADRLLGQSRGRASISRRCAGLRARPGSRRSSPRDALLVARRDPGERSRSTSLPDTGLFSGDVIVSESRAMECSTESAAGSWRSWPPASRLPTVPTAGSASIAARSCCRLRRRRSSPATSSASRIRFRPTSLMVDWNVVVSDRPRLRARALPPFDVRRAADRS